MAENHEIKNKDDYEYHIQQLHSTVQFYQQQMAATKKLLRDNPDKTAEWTQEEIAEEIRQYNSAWPFSWLKWFFMKASQSTPLIGATLKRVYGAPTYDDLNLKQHWLVAKDYDMFAAQHPTQSPEQRLTTMHRFSIQTESHSHRTLWPQKWRGVWNTLQNTLGKLWSYLTPKGAQPAKSPASILLEKIDPAHHKKQSPVTPVTPSRPAAQSAVAPVSTPPSRIAVAPPSASLPSHFSTALVTYHLPDTTSLSDMVNSFAAKGKTYLLFRYVCAALKIPVNGSSPDNIRETRKALEETRDALLARLNSKNDEEKTYPLDAQDLLLRSRREMEAAKRACEQFLADGLPERGIVSDAEIEEAIKDGGAIGDLQVAIHELRSQAATFATGVQALSEGNRRDMESLRQLRKQQDEQAEKIRKGYDDIKKRDEAVTEGYQGINKQLKAALEQADIRIIQLNVLLKERGMPLIGECKPTPPVPPPAGSGVVIGANLEEKSQLERESSGTRPSF